MPEGLVGHAFPELLESWHAVVRFVSGDQARIDRADGGADDPVRLDAGLVQCLIDSGLVGAKRTTALEDEDDLLRRRLTDAVRRDSPSGSLRDGGHFGIP